MTGDEMLLLHSAGQQGQRMRLQVARCVVRWSSWPRRRKWRGNEMRPQKGSGGQTWSSEHSLEGTHGDKATGDEGYTVGGGRLNAGREQEEKKKKGEEKDGMVGAKKGSQPGECVDEFGVTCAVLLCRQSQPAAGWLARPIYRRRGLALASQLVLARRFN